MSETTVYKSPLTGLAYHIYEVSPMAFSMINEAATESEQARNLRVQGVQVWQTIRATQEALAKLPEDQKAPVQEQLGKDMVRLQNLQLELASLTKVTPKIMCNMLRTFVKELEGKTDLEILRTGKDIDLLFVQVRGMADRDSDNYNKALENALEFFRSPRAPSNSASS